MRGISLRLICVICVICGSNFGCTNLNELLQPRTEIIVPAKYVGGQEGDFITFRSGKDLEVTVSGAWGKDSFEAVISSKADSVINARTAGLQTIELQRSQMFNSAMARLEALVQSIMGAALAINQQGPPAESGESRLDRLERILERVLERPGDG